MSKTRVEKIRSDRTGRVHLVKVENGVAIACNCIHGISGRKGVCYHKKRAEIAPAFRQARKAFILAGHFANRAEFDEFFRRRAEVVGDVDEVIQSVLENCPEAPSQRVCSRCGGEKRLECFAHVQNGICFRCNGRGITR